MATALERYQLYVSHVEQQTRTFFASLDARPEEEVRAMLERKEFGRRMYLARIWLDFRKNMRQEADDEECLHRINRAIELRESVTGMAAGDMAKVKLGPSARDSLLAFANTLKGFVLRR